MADINRVASVDQVKGIRNKVSYWLVWTRIIYNGKAEGCIGKSMKMDGMHFLKLDRKAIKAKIREYIAKMEVGDDIDLYVNYGYDNDEQLMTLTKNGDGMKAHIDDPLGICQPDLVDYQE